MPLKKMYNFVSFLSYSLYLYIMIVYQLLSDKRYIDIDKLYTWIHGEKKKSFPQLKTQFKERHLIILKDISTKRFFGKTFITPENARCICYKTKGNIARALFIALTEDLTK